MKYLESFASVFSQLIQSFLSFLKIVLKSHFFLEKHQTKINQCYILGNGPSLKKILSEEIDLLTKNDAALMCLNKFPVTSYYKQLQPSYYIFVSTEFWRPGKIEHHQQGRDEIINRLVEDTDWPITLFCPSEAKASKKFINKFLTNPNIKLIFYNKTPVEGLPYFNRLFMRLGWGSPRPHNVMIPAILMAINSGFKDIYLLGADHSWLPMISVDENNRALLNQQHFYDDQKDNTEEMYRSGIRPRRLHEILEKFMLSFRAYFDLSDYAKSCNVNIYNATPDSFIDAFPRRQLPK